MKKWTHKELVEKSIAWLKKNHGSGGAGCHVAVSEFPTGFSGEIPDAIGYRVNGEIPGGVVVCEAKTSRSDFLADMKKPHRNGKVIGVGQHRFYVAPKNMIKIDELPEKWGLVEISDRGGSYCVSGFPATTNFFKRQEIFDNTFFKSDTKKEMNILIRLLSRIGDSEKLNNIKRLNSRLEHEVAKLKIEISELKKENLQIRRKL